MFPLVQLDVILREVLIEVLRAENIGDLHKLIGVVPPEEDVVDSENLRVSLNSGYH